MCYIMPQSMTTGKTNDTSSLHPTNVMSANLVLGIRSQSLHTIKQSVREKKLPKRQEPLVEKFVLDVFRLAHVLTKNIERDASHLQWATEVFFKSLFCPV